MTAIKDTPRNREVFAKSFKEAYAYAKMPETQVKLAEVFGVSGTTINNWRGGKKLPSMEHAIDIAKKCGVCVEWLLTRRGRPVPDEVNDERLSDIILAWRVLSDDTKEDLHSIVTRRTAHAGPKTRQLLSETTETPHQD